MAGTFFIAFFLRKFKNSRFFPGRVCGLEALGKQELGAGGGDLASGLEPGRGPLSMALAHRYGG